MKIFQSALLLVLLALISCKTKDKSNNSGDFKIEGTIEGAKAGEAVVFQKVFAGERKSDTALLDKEGHFTFKGSIDEPVLGAVYFASGIERENLALTFFIEPGTTTLTGKKSAWNTANVSGGASNDDLKKIEAIMQQYYAKMKLLGDSLYALKSAGKTNELQALEGQYLQLEKQQKEAVIQFVKAHPDSYASAFFAYQFSSYGMELPAVENLYQGLSANMKNSVYAKKLKNVLDALKATGIGSKAPEFTLNTPAGTPIALSSYKGKYVLLDFWASWCGPCRQENPNVVKAYQAFKSRNFTVLGVSLDEDKEAWQKAILKDHLEWQHVSDLKGWGSSVAAMYSVQAIPANFLIDTAGVVIAKDLRGADLEKKLNEVLK